MTDFRHLGDDEVASLHRIRVVRGRFEAPDGSTFERDVIRDKRVVAMVPVLDDGHTVLLVRQYRGPVDRQMLEIPVGLCAIEGEDDPEVTARWELAEEIGRRPGRLALLATMHEAAGISDACCTIYLATGLTEVPDDHQGPEEAAMTVESFDLADLDAAIAAGTLTDAKTLVGLLTARRRLRP